MTVNNLSTPEDGVTLDTRDARLKNGKKGEAEVAQELAAIRERIGVAATIRPEDGFHCSDCAKAWTDGRDAAVKAIEGR